MAVYSCNVPLRVTCALQDKDKIIKYTIYASPDGVTFEVIHTGAIYPFSDSEAAQINLSPIVRQYLTTWYEEFIPTSMAAFHPVINKQSPLQTFRIEIEQVDSRGNPSMTSQDFQFKYDYNTDYVATLPDQGELNDLIEYKVLGGQFLTICNYTDTSQSVTVSASTSRTITGVGFAFDAQPVPTGASGYMTSQSIIGSTGYPSKTYEIVRPCPNQYVLYYVNKKGGLDWLVVRGTPIVSYETDRTDFRTLRQRENRMDFENMYIRQDITKRYELTTNMLNGDQSDKMDNVFFSPKMWLFNVATQTINAVIMTDTSFTRKMYPRDKDMTYTLRVQESQLQLRK